MGNVILSKQLVRVIVRETGTRSVQTVDSQLTCYHSSPALIRVRDLPGAENRRVFSLVFLPCIMTERAMCTDELSQGRA